MSRARRYDRYKKHKINYWISRIVYAGRKIVKLRCDFKAHIMSHVNTYRRRIECCIPTFNHMQHKYIPLFTLEHESWQFCTRLSSLIHFLFVYSSFQSRVTTSCQRRAQTDHKTFSNRNYTPSVPYSFRIYRYHVNACSLKTQI